MCTLYISAVYVDVVRLHKTAVDIDVLTDVLVYRNTDILFVLFQFMLKPDEGLLATTLYSGVFSNMDD